MIDYKNSRTIDAYQERCPIVLIIGQNPQDFARDSRKYQLLNGSKSLVFGRVKSLVDTPQPSRLLQLPERTVLGMGLLPDLWSPLEPRKHRKEGRRKGEGRAKAGRRRAVVQDVIHAGSMGPRFIKKRLLDDSPPPTPGQPRAHPIRARHSPACGQPVRNTPAEAAREAILRPKYPLYPLYPLYTHSHRGADTHEQTCGGYMGVQGVRSYEGI